MTRPDLEGQAPPLLLDEMHSPAVATALRELGHDVVAVAERPDLRAMSDEDLFAWAAAEERCIVTENVKDFRRLLREAEEREQRHPRLLFTSSRTFPRTRRNPGPLIAALDTWLGCRPSPSHRTEEWLRPNQPR